MKKSFHFIVFMMILVFAGSLFGQGLKIGPAIGYTKIQNDLIPDYDFEYGSEIHYGGKAKFDIPMVPISPVLSVYYVKFNGDGSYDGPMLLDFNQSNFNVESNLLSIGIGGEMSLLPGPVSPYLALDILFNSFGDTKVTSDDFNFQNNVGDGVSRQGLGLGAGVEFTLLPAFDVDLSLKYNFNNLIGKEDGEDNFNTLQITANVLFDIL